MRFTRSIVSIFLLLPAAVPSLVTACMAIIAPIFLMSKNISLISLILMIVMTLYFFIGVVSHPLDVVTSQFITPFIVCIALIINFGKGFESQNKILMLILIPILVIDMVYLPYHNKGFVSVLLLSYLLPAKNKLVYTAILFTVLLYYYVTTNRSSWLLLMAFTICPLVKVYIRKNIFLTLIIAATMLMLVIGQMSIFDPLSTLESNFAIRVKMLEHAIEQMQWHDWISGIGFGTPYRSTDVLGTGYFSPSAVLYVSNHNSYFDLMMRFGIIVVVFLTKFLPEISDDVTIKIKQSFIYSYLFVWGTFNAALDSAIAFSGIVLAIILLKALKNRSQHDIYRIAI